MAKKFLDLTGLQHYDEKIKSFISAEVAEAKALATKFETVEAIPAPATAKGNTIYLVPSVTTSDNNTYDEYILVGDKMEFIGTTACDLSSIHETGRAKASGLYKITTDEAGHVSAAVAVTNDDIEGYLTSVSNAEIDEMFTD